MLNESQFLWKLSKQKMSQNTCEFLVKSTEKCSAKKTLVILSCRAMKLLKLTP